MGTDKELVFQVHISRREAMCEGFVDRQVERARLQIAKAISRVLLPEQTLTVRYTLDCFDVQMIAATPEAPAHLHQHRLEFVKYPSEPILLAENMRLKERIKELEGIIADHSILAAADEGF